MFDSTLRTPSRSLPTILLALALAAAVILAFAGLAVTAGGTVPGPRAAVRTIPIVVFVVADAAAPRHDVTP